MSHEELSTNDKVQYAPLSVPVTPVGELEAAAVAPEVAEGVARGSVVGSGVLWWEGWED